MSPVSDQQLGSAKRVEGPADRPLHVKVGHWIGQPCGLLSPIACQVPRLQLERSALTAGCPSVSMLLFISGEAFMD